MDLDQLDAEQYGPMVVRLDGETLTLRPATDMAWRLVVAAAADPFYFGGLVWPGAVRLPYRKLQAVQRAWVAHNGLPEIDQIRRLVYMFERYFTGVEYDLRAHLQVSARELWQERRWRELLNYIDLLPANSHKNRLLSQDEEYMEMLLTQKSNDTGPVRPSMADWSLTNSLLSTLVDAVNKNTAVQQGIANPKGPKPRIDPMPRPATAAERVEWRLQKKRHEDMVSLLLPAKRQDAVS